jgi:hypothetical protein
MGALVFLLGAGYLYADELHLKNGDIKTGKIVKMDEETVVFEIEKGALRAVVKYDRDQIKEIVETKDEQAGKEEEALVSPVKDKEKYLERTLEMTDDKDRLPIAYQRLVKLVKASTPEELQEFNREVEDVKDKSLDMIMAEIHMKVAKDEGKGRRLDLGEVEGFERASLLELLRTEAEQALQDAQVQVSMDDRRAMSYARKRIDYAVAVLREQLQHDPTLDEQNMQNTRATIQDLLERKKSLYPKREPVRRRATQQRRRTPSRRTQPREEMPMMPDMMPPMPARPRGR